MNYTDQFTDILYEQLKQQVTKSQISSMIEQPKYAHMGDIAFPCFELAKIYRQSPQQIALELANNMQSLSLFEKVEAINGYVNVFLNKVNISSQVLEEIISQQANYGNVELSGQEVITIDFSSPNIAKPFSMGHLRSTVIGNSLALIAEKCGYKPVRINHLGDWGTQFGKLITAYHLWGDEQLVRKNPIKELFTLYIRFHEEAEKNEELNEQGRQWFKKLEDGDEEALQLWKWFRDESIKEFSKIYELLHVPFDSYHGEAFYNDKMEKVVELLTEQNLLQESEGAQVVPLDGQLPPCLIKKKDGTTLYATRDIAAAIYRQQTYQVAKSIYVVGNEQTLHFQQLFNVIEKMGYEWHEGLTHVPFGMILKDGKKMSTRKGKVVLLEDVLHDAIELATNNIQDKNPSLAFKEEVARQVGVGAVIFHDLKNYRLNDIEFSLEEMLKFEGETGPYVQYTHARASSILHKAAYHDNDATLTCVDELSWSIIKSLMEFPHVIQQAFDRNDPSKIAKYVLQLSKAFNKYYGAVRILKNDNQQQVRLKLVQAVQIVLNEGLHLLGIEAPSEM
ncbi:arginine--tRNA ligase [Gracilibacillus sp. S3-1-1]|uniref:Arginine--tRNA ligase n=1 Tax=Gracilibacillus pellucidus TaxID=3095368 RepID=A0ACC6M206_9BACI|nr:arginine--tRNA ligase [Gracilibacillus sp. S3-1-1]MDX8044962.1 arginine--tRNA ligase [Gracilibacillus sp. S3-1-1]